MDRPRKDGPPLAELSTQQLSPFYYMGGKKVKLEIVTRKKLKRLKKYKKACKQVYRLLTAVHEDENGNVVAYRQDHLIKSIRDILEPLEGKGWTAPWEGGKG